MAYIKSVQPEQESPPGVMMRFPKQSRAIMQYTQDVMRDGECNFSHEEREIIAAFTSAMNNCNFCYGAHKATAAAFGVEESFLEALVTSIESAPVDDKMRPVLAFAKKLTLTPSQITQGDVDAVLDAGWTEIDFHYLTSICAIFNFYNRLMEAYGCSLGANPEVPVEAVGELLSTNGYIFDAPDQ